MAATRAQTACYPFTWQHCYNACHSTGHLQLQTTRQGVSAHDRPKHGLSGGACPASHLTGDSVAQVFDAEQPKMPPKRARTLRCARPEEGEQLVAATGVHMIGMWYIAQCGGLGTYLG